MKKIAVLIILCGGILSAQQTAPHYKFGDDDSLKFSVKPELGNAHEYALDSIRRYSDYMNKPRPYGNGFRIDTDKDLVFRYVFHVGSNQDGYQEFTVTPEGKIELHNISIEDALLSLVANQTREWLDSAQRYDAQEEKAEAERSSHPPTRLKAHGKSIKISNVSEIGPGIYGQTNCKVGTIKILMSDEAKRETVLHEMMHIASNCDDKVHRAIYELSSPLLKMLQDNPDMVDYLTKRKDKP